MRVVFDGEDVTPTAPRQRDVLLRLALSPGRPVSAGALLNDVWGAGQPGGGAKAVAFQITRLRDTLESDRSGEGTAISTGPDGYTLLVDEHHVDMYRFDALVSDARAALADDPPKALDLAEDATKLWRGEPFGDQPDTPFVNDERLRLKRRYVDARVIVAEALLA
jgi:DNA-binding SARP family transcriptional activator